MKGILRSPYGSRLFWFSVLIATLPVIILGLYSYYKASGIAIQKVYEGQMQITQQTELRVEQFLKAVDAASLELVSAPIVNQALDRGLHYSEFQMIQELRGYLQRIQAYELRIQDVQLINTARQWVIENSGFYRMEDYKGELPPLGDNLSGKNASWTPSGTDAGAHVSLIRKLPLNSPNPTLFVAIKITVADINKYVMDIPETGKTYILDENLNVLADPDSRLLGRAFPDQGLLEALPDERRKLKPLQATFDHQAVSVSFQRSAYNGWLYLTLVPVADITRESKAIGWITLYICLGIIVAALIVAYKHSHYLYRPIRVLYESVKGASGAGGPSRQKLDELKFIDERFRSLNLSHTDMKRQLHGQRQQVMDYFVLKLFQGHIRASDIEEKLAVLQYPLQWRQKAALIIQIDTLEGSRYQESDMDLLLFAIHNMAEEIIPPECRLSPILIHPSQVTLVGSASEDNEQFRNLLFSLSEQMQESAMRYLDLRISVGISRSYQSWTDMPKAYQEGLEALKYRMKLGQEAIIFIEDIQPPAEVRRPYPQAVARQLLDAIKLLQTERLDELLEQFMEECFSQARSREDYQAILARLLIELTELGQQYGVTWHPSGPRRLSPFERLLEMNMSGEIMTWFRDEIIGAITGAVERSHIPKDTKITEQLLEMIHANIESGLTLELCAEKLHYHPSHLKRVFRRDMGVNFSDYVSHHRLQVAKQWLTESHMKVTEIADRLQYNNTQNFIRYFRKLEGMTPGQYREQFRKTE